jgi:sigma-E factor negative regulatory protein RseB
MKYIIPIIFIVFTANTHAGIFFKIANDNSTYSTFIVKGQENMEIQTHLMIKRMKDNYFNISNVDTNFYQITINRGTVLFNNKIIVYELIPTFNDRFKHVVWITEDNVIVRKEVYDLKGKLMFSYGYVDELPHIKQGHKSRKRTVDNNICSEIGEFIGFKVIGCRYLDEDTKHVVYSDGLNKFSIFIDEGAEEKINKKKVVLGNYVYRKSIGHNVYTAVGLIPFDTMDRVIKYINSKEEVNETND